MFKPEQLNDNWKYHCVFALTLVLAVVLRIVYYMGPSGADDMIYFSAVEKLLAGQDPGTVIGSFRHWGVRLGIILPVWGIMKVFGVSQFSSMVLPLLLSAGIMALIYAAGIRFFNPAVALVSVASFAILPQDVYLSTVIYPDGPVVFFSLLFIYLFYRLSGSKDSSWKRSLAAGFVLGLAYFERETALILLITIPMLYFHSPDKKTYFKTVGFVFAGLLIAICLEMVIFRILADNPFLRWEILLGKTKVLAPRKFTVYSQGHGASGSLYARYLIEPFFVVFATHWISPLMISVVSGILFLQARRVKNYKFLSFKEGHFLWLFILTFGILAYYAYGPIYGLTIPLKRSVRYYHTITPLASLLLGVVLYELFTHRGFMRFIGYVMVFFYAGSSIICMGSIINKNAHGLEMIEKFMDNNPAETYIMPELLRTTLQMKRGLDYMKKEVVTYPYIVTPKKRPGVNDELVNNIISGARKAGAVQYVFVVPKLHKIQISYWRDIKWPMEKLSPVTVMSTPPGMSCRITRSWKGAFDLLPDVLKSKLCYTTDIYVYRLI